MNKFFSFPKSPDGHPKENICAPIFNIAIAYDCNNQIPLFYEESLGSTVDVSQLQYMLTKAKAHKYHQVGFILDRGYFCKENILYDHFSLLWEQRISWYTDNGIPHRKILCV